MENIENIKGLVNVLTSMNKSLTRYFIKRGKFPERDRLYFISLEESFYKSFGIKVEINSLDDLLSLEEKYRKKLEEKKPKERSVNKIEFETQFNIGDRVRIKLKCKLSKPVTGRILGIFYTETADPWEEYPKGFDTIVKKVMYRVMLDDMTDREMRDLEARHYLPEDLELIQ